MGAASALETDAALYAAVNMRNPPRSYFIRAGRRLHSLKAVVTYALQQEAPNTMARDFHAADAAARVAELEFDVVHESNEVQAEREREWLSRLSRLGQRAFREKLIDLYGGCPLSGCATLTVLEAAHVDPVAARGIDAAANGILLRADLHKLFDAGLLAVNPVNGSVEIARNAAKDYNDLKKVRFSPPKGGPTLTSFVQRWRTFETLHGAR